MKLYKITEDTTKPEIGIKYTHTSEGLVVKITSAKRLAVDTMSIDKLWNKRITSRLIDQIIKATIKPTGKEIRLSSLKETAAKLAQSEENLDIVFYLSPGFKLDNLYGNNFSIERIEYRNAKIEESKNDVQVISTHREMPDDPLDVIVRVKDLYYRYKYVGYDDLETFRWMLKKGAGFKALNWFKKKGYEYEKVDR